MTDDWNELAWLSGKHIDLKQLLLYAQNKPALSRQGQQYLMELRNNCQRAIWCIEALVKLEKSD